MGFTGCYINHNLSRFLPLLGVIKLVWVHFRVPRFTLLGISDRYGCCCCICGPFCEIPGNMSRVYGCDMNANFSCFLFFLGMIKLVHVGLFSCFSVCFAWLW